MSEATRLTKLPTWHAGERAIQEKAGVAGKMEIIGQRNVRDYMPEQHRAFYAQLPFIVAGSVDHHGDPWATFMVGQPGFLGSPSPALLDLDGARDPDDPASAGMSEGDAMGLLGIEFHTRRRNRVNGIVRTSSQQRLRIEVDQAFGNCPQYIQLRDVYSARELAGTRAAPVEAFSSLDAKARATIAAADTFFVASYAEREDRRQVDVSHRGGKHGFVRVGADGLLTIPDFAGNLFFDTLGNILLNGKAGLVFADFETGDLLQMTGDAEVILDSPEIAAFQGAERLWTFRPRRVIRRQGVVPLRWSTQEYGASPNSLMTGDWRAAAETLKAADLTRRWRSFKVVKIVDESRSIRSFHLKPDDGTGLIPSKAGQHIPIRVTLPGALEPTVRTYTLSSAPSDAAYRISIKREGHVSGYLHDHLRLGDTLEAHAPAGAFTLDPGSKRHAVLLAGGVGITPMLAMLRDIVDEGQRTHVTRTATLFYAAHAKADRAFAEELAQLAELARGSVRIVRVLSDVRDAQEGSDFDVAGRIDMALLSNFLPFGDYEFYVCGPASLTQALYDGLSHWGVADKRIHAETFGPSSLVRNLNTKVVASPKPAASDSDVQIEFTASSKKAVWTPASGSLLDLAEAQGLTPAFSCRSGSCGTCKTKLLAGAVTYPTEPTAERAADEILICCAVPAQGERRIVLDL